MSSRIQLYPQAVMSSTQNPKEKATEVVDTNIDQDPSEDSDPEAIQDINVVSSTSKKKKKKKKSKIAKLLGAGKDEIPQELVDRVLDQVKGDRAVGSEDLNAENVREALEQLKIMDVVRGKAGLGGLNKKDIGEHKVA